mmetsp:Transcript_34283/g.113430  ORF Transcript_34283/g.113430 Transcript_34283/m.113430 type:complete len:338 (-) Transcript_34283:230-1243(-)
MASGGGPRRWRRSRRWRGSRQGGWNTQRSQRRRRPRWRSGRWTLAARARARSFARRTAPCSSTPGAPSPAVPSARRPCMRHSRSTAASGSWSRWGASGWSPSGRRRRLARSSPPVRSSWKGLRGPSRRSTFMSSARRTRPTRTGCVPCWSRWSTPPGSDRCRSRTVASRARRLPPAPASTGAYGSRTAGDSRGRCSLWSFRTSPRTRPSASASRGRRSPRASRCSSRRPSPTRRRSASCRGQARQACFAPGSSSTSRRACSSTRWRWRWATPRLRVRSPRRRRRRRRPGRSPRRRGVRLLLRPPPPRLSLCLNLFLSSPRIRRSSSARSHTSSSWTP